MLPAIASLGTTRYKRIPLHVSVPLALDVAEVGSLRSREREA